MIKTFEFYFDFASPYSYIAHKEIDKIEKKFKIKISYMPIYLRGLHKLLGITAPAFIPSKAKFIIKDCKLIYTKIIGIIAILEIVNEFDKLLFIYKFKLHYLYFIDYEKNHIFFLLNFY